jgi:transcriptional regulator with XRE-family HTH domain
MKVQTGTRQTNTALFARRLEAGLSQSEQAAAIGVTQRVYQYAEAGGTPQPRHIARFSAYYGVSAFDLFYPEMKEAA